MTSLPHPPSGRKPAPLCPECGQPMTDRPYGGTGDPYPWSCSGCADGGPGYQPTPGPVRLKGQQEIDAHIEEAERQGWVSAHQRAQRIPSNRWPLCPRCDQPMEPNAGTARIWFDCQCPWTPPVPGDRLGTRRNRLVEDWRPG